MNHAALLKANKLESKEVEEHMWKAITEGCRIQKKKALHDLFGM